MKILISQTASLGDVILSTPVVNALNKHYPQAQLWFLSSSSGVDLLKSNPVLADLITYDKKGKDKGLNGLLKKSRELRRQNFDVVYAIQRSARVSILLAMSGIKKRVGFKSSALPFLFTNTVERITGFHDVERNLSILSHDIIVAEEEKELQLVEPQLANVSPELRAILNAEPYVAVFPGSLWYTKRWNAHNFALLGKTLSENNIRVLYFGSPQEKQLVDECAKLSNSLSLAGRTSLQELIFAISNAKIVVCNDSSSLHIASAFKINTTAIFCATSPQMGFGPWRNPNCQIIAEETLWCRPCSRHGSEFCPTGTEACMKGSKNGVNVENVASCVIKLWKNPP